MWNLHDVDVYEVDQSLPHVYLQHSQLMVLNIQESVEDTNW